MSDSEEIEFESADEGEEKKSDGTKKRRKSSESKNTETEKEEKAVAEETPAKKETPEDEKPESSEIVTEEPTAAGIEREHEVEETEEEKHQHILDKLSEAAEEQGGGWNIGGWGSSLLTTATASVSEFTHQVEEGFTTMVETVEATLAVPSPEELAAQDAEALKEHDVDEEEELKKQEEEDKSNEAEGGGWFSSFSSITSVVQSTGKNLVAGTLDVLENVGKKTINILNDQDPGFQKTRALFRGRGDKPDLSQILKEAREDSDKRAEQEKEYEETQKAQFSYLFDEAQGLAHLEALEMLSNESERKVQSILQSLSSGQMDDIKVELIKVKAKFECDFDDMDEEDKEHDFVKLVTEHLSNLQINASPDKILKAQSKASEWLEKYETNKDTEECPPAKDLHQTAIASLAEITSIAMEQFHKAGELLLLKKDSPINFEERAKDIADLTQTFCMEVGVLSTRFTVYLNKAAEKTEEDKDVINALVTNVYLEATNSSTYIQDAFQLLLPVLQLATIESKI